MSEIWERVRAFFSRIAPDMKKALHIGVVITDRLNHFVQSPGADILTELIKGDWDDKIKEALRVELPKIVVELKLAEKCSTLTDPNEIVACAIEELKQISGDYKSAFLHDLSILIAQIAADGKLSWSDGVYLLQWYYEHRE